jgi:hypothetical protein
MILILAKKEDAAAVSLVKRWAEHDARLLTPEDLSVAGWCHKPGTPRNGRVVVGGAGVPIDDLRGVLVRLPAVAESDLPHIRAADRGYVAMEMTAFLVAWLASLPCPVINPPTPMCLAGPRLRPEQWAHAAARENVPVATIARTSQGYKPPAHSVNSVTTVTVVGKWCHGARSQEQAERAHRIARATGANLVHTYFIGPHDDPVFVGADPWVDLYEPVFADAVLALLLGRDLPTLEGVS